MWLARDLRFDALCMYEEKPIKQEDVFKPRYGGFYYLNKDKYPEVTWENSPVKIEITLKL